MATDDKERHRETIIKQRNEAEESTVNDQPSPFASSPARPVPTADEIAPTRHRDPVIGAHVGGYVVKGRLGSGGMGIVYEGEQPMIGKRVAIKVLRPEVADNPDVVERLVAEARAVNQVGHRGIIDVFAFGELPDGRQCIVMEYLDGESLDAILQMYQRERRLMPIGDVLIILDEILSALAAAHTAGVIHRDLKPSNIFLCRQRDGARYVKLLDFGIAKLGVLGGATPVSRASLMVGTPSYMAPEQAKGGNVGPPMDLYAVGVMAFEMFTGRLPFIMDSVVAVIMAHQSDPVPRPSSIVMSIPDVIDEMVLKLMSKKPEDRYANADQVRQVVTTLRKELADTTSKRMLLEITVSEREKAEAVARNGQNILDAARRAEIVAAGPKQVPIEALQTIPIPPRPKVEQLPEQLKQTAEDLIAPPERKSNRGLIIGLLGLIGALIIGAVVVGGGEKPVEPVKPPPEPVVVVAKPPEPEPVVAKPEPVVVAEPKPPEPVVVEQPKPVEPVVAKPVVAKPVVVANPAAKSKAQTAKLNARVKKLDARLLKATREGSSVDLYVKQVTKIQGRLDDPTLADDERDRLESAISRLEQSTDF